uniref:Uncharacterized protein n=1 Tax=Arundo donax TaxID=35708 RepID=A0A0A9FIM8_ARUDO
MYKAVAAMFFQDGDTYCRPAFSALLAARKGPGQMTAVDGRHHHENLCCLVARVGRNVFQW